MNVCRGTVFASVVLVERVRQHSVSRRRRRFGARLGGDYGRHAPPATPASCFARSRLGRRGSAHERRRVREQARLRGEGLRRRSVRAPLRATRARVPAAHQPRVPREGHRRARGRGRVPGRAPSRRRTRPPGGRVRSPDRLHRRGLRHDVLPPPRGAPRPRVVRRDRPRGDRPREGARRERGPGAPRAVRGRARRGARPTPRGRGEADPGRKPIRPRRGRGRGGLVSRRGRVQARRRGPSRPPPPRRGRRVARRPDAPDAGPRRVLPGVPPGRRAALDARVGGDPGGSEKCQCSRRVRVVRPDRAGRVPVREADAPEPRRARVLARGREGRAEPP